MWAHPVLVGSSRGFESIVEVGGYNGHGRMSLMVLMVLMVLKEEHPVTKSWIEVSGEAEGLSTNWINTSTPACFC